MIDWTRVGAGLASLPPAHRTPEAVRNFYAPAVQAWNQYAPMQNQGITMGARSLVEIMNRAKERDALGGQAAPVRGLINYNQSQGVYPTVAAANQALATKGIDAYTPAQLMAGRDWSLREQARKNAQGPTGFGGLFMKAAPAIMGWGVGGFAAPSMSGLFSLGSQNLAGSGISQFVNQLRR